MHEMESLAPSRQDGAVYTQRRVSTALKDHFERESEKYQTQTSAAQKRMSSICYTHPMSPLNALLFHPNRGILLRRQQAIPP